MNTYVILLRGINVGGKNKVSMADLKKHLQELTFSKVVTLGVSGNIMLQSNKHNNEIKTQVEELLPKVFKLDSELIKVLVLSHKQIQTVIDSRPRGFGDHPDKYHSDAIFLIGIDVTDAMPVFNPREGIDKIWPGNGMVYSQRLSAERTKSRLSTMMMSPLYKSMTIRSWGTTVKILNILKSIDVSTEA